MFKQGQKLFIRNEVYVSLCKNRWDAEKVD